MFLRIVRQLNKLFMSAGCYEINYQNKLKVISASSRFLLHKVQVSKTRNVILKWKIFSWFLPVIQSPGLAYTRTQSLYIFRHTNIFLSYELHIPAAFHRLQRAWLLPLIIAHTSLKCRLQYVAVLFHLPSYNLLLQYFKGRQRHRTSKPPFWWKEVKGYPFTNYLNSDCHVTTK